MDKLIGNISKLKPGNLRNYKRTIQMYNSQDYKNFVNLSSGGYNKNLIYRNEDFELFVITWNVNQYSNIHDHSSNGCLFKILEGSILEKQYDINTKKHFNSDTYYKNDIAYIDNNLYYHKMLNIFKKPCVSLHLYSPPNFKAKYLD